MVVSEITLFNTLKAKLGEQDAQVVVEGIKSTVRDEFESQKGIFLTKDDKVELIKEIKESKSDIIKWMFIFVVGLFFSLGGLMIGLFNLFPR